MFSIRLSRITTIKMNLIHSFLFYKKMQEKNKFQEDRMVGLFAVLYTILDLDCPLSN